MTAASAYHKSEAAERYSASDGKHGLKREPTAGWTNTVVQAFNHHNAKQQPSGHYGGKADFHVEPARQSQQTASGMVPWRREPDAEGIKTCTAKVI